MRYKLGAEQLQQVPSLVHRPDTVFRAARTAPVGPTHAVGAASGAVACGIKADRLQVLDQDWKTACFVEKCPGCFAAVVTPNEASWHAPMGVCPPAPVAVVEHRVPAGQGVPSKVDGGIVQPASGSG